MKWWLAIVLAGGLLVTLWASTIPAVTVHEQSARERAESQRIATALALRTAERAYREHARADSLLPLLPAAPGVNVLLSPALPPEAGAQIHAAVARELAGVGEPGARVGVFLIDDRYGRRTHVPIWSGEGREIYVGTDSAGSFCAMVGTASTMDGVMQSSGFGVVSSRHRRTNAPASVLGPCAFVARYGAPGPGIAQWLSSGGYRFADLSGTAVPDWSRERATALERQLWLWSRTDLWLRGCRGGRAELCSAVALEPARELLNRDGPASFDLTAVEWYDANHYRTLLHHVEQQFGREAFARFWTSAADVQTAFASAFGLEFGDWVREWSEDRYGTATLGARLDGVTMLLSLLALAGLGAISGVIAARRRLA